jgi:hypothetical protein
MNGGEEKETGGSPSSGAVKIGEAFAGECAPGPKPLRDHDRRRGRHTGGVLTQSSGRADVTEAMKAEGEPASISGERCPRRRGELAALQDAGRLLLSDLTQDQGKARAGNLRGNACKPADRIEGEGGPVEVHRRAIGHEPAEPANGRRIGSVVSLLRVQAQQR